MTNPLSSSKQIDEMYSTGIIQEPSSSPDDLPRVLSRVTHDINNPLTIISGNAQLLLEMSEDLTPDVAEQIAEIEEACQRLAQIVGRLSAANERVNGKAATLDNGTANGA